MTLTEKLEVMKQVHVDTDSITFGKRSLILANLAKKLGLKLWIGMGVWEICHQRRRAPLLILSQ